MSLKMSTTDLINKRFGRLIVSKFYDKGYNSNSRWLCQCDCGRKAIISRNHLMDGKTVSCGCYRYELTKTIATDHIKHHKYKTRLYKIWAGMKTRCQNPNEPEYFRYSGRGILVCEEWQGFQPFYDWAVSHEYSENLSIDRINSDGNYEPSNCRWATPKQQANNTRRTLWVTFNGEKRAVTEWSEILGINHYTLYNRISNLNWPIEKAFNTPVRTKEG